MVGIPKQFQKAGLEATDAAKAAVRRINEAVRETVIPNSKLVREPSSDMFEKASYMTEESFWKEPQNLGNYFRGEFLAAGGDYSKMEKFVDEYGYEYARINLPDGKWLKVTQDESGTVFVREPYCDRYASLDKNNRLVYAEQGDGNCAKTYRLGKSDRKLIADEWDGYPYKTNVYEKDGKTLHSVRENINHDISGRSGGTETFYDKEGNITKQAFYDRSVAYKDELETCVPASITHFKDGKPSVIHYIDPKNKYSVNMAQYYDTEGNIVKTINLDA